MKVINYLVPNYLQGRNDKNEVIGNSTINNPETLKFFKILN